MMERVHSLISRYNLIYFLDQMAASLSTYIRACILSYSHHYVSLLLVHLFHSQGYLVGNPATGEKIDLNSEVPYAHRVGIISDQLYEVINLL